LSEVLKIVVGLREKTIGHGVTTKMLVNKNNDLKGKIDNAFSYLIHCSMVVELRDNNPLIEHLKDEFCINFRRIR
jgi:hypothetical protein